MLAWTLGQLISLLPAGALALAVTHFGRRPGLILILVLIIVVAVVVYLLVRRRRRGALPEGSQPPIAGISTVGSTATSPPLVQPAILRPAPAPASADGATPALLLEGLSKSYGSLKAVDGLSFAVRPGSVCGFAGPNGAGKTTTIRMLLGLISPTAGTASVLGHSIHNPASYLSRVGALIEGPAFYPPLNGRRNLEVLATLGGIDKREVDRVLEQVDLRDRARDPFRSYSLGMKQRLGIAAALLPRPELLVLDEPTNGLDPTGIREVRTLLRSLGNEGTTVFISSHLLEELQQMCDEVVIIRQGQLLFAGEVDALIQNQQSDLIAVPEHAQDLERLGAICAQAGYPTSTTATGQLHVAAPVGFSAELNRTAMAAGITLVELGRNRQSLEDVFFELTEGQKS
jgi:ABC-2 type transport system ATP-binding protein